MPVSVAITLTGGAEMAAALKRMAALAPEMNEQIATELVEIGETATKLAIVDKDLLFRRALLNSVEGNVVSQGSPVGSSFGGEVYSELVYAEVMDLGRRPGSRPPPSSALEPWVKKKIGGNPAQVKAVAWLIARSIGRKGIEGRHYFAKGLEAVAAAAQKVTERIVEFLRRVA